MFENIKEGTSGEYAHLHIQHVFYKNLSENLPVLNSSMQMRLVRLQDDTSDIKTQRYFGLDHYNLFSST